MSDGNAAGGFTHVLSDGNQIPRLGLGVWQVPDGPECENAVRWALERATATSTPRRPTATRQASAGRCRQRRPARGGLHHHEVLSQAARTRRPRLERSLERLGVDHVDLYIVHWPRGGPTWAWPGMERAQRARPRPSIGVSNFSVAELDALLEVASDRPVVNQVQFSPFEYRRALLEACERGIALEAYSPLGTGRHLEEPVVFEIAERFGRTPAQVLIRWCLQRDDRLPKSTHRERIEENGQVFDFELSDQDMAALDGLDRTGGTAEARESKWW